VDDTSRVINDPEMQMKSMWLCCACKKITIIPFFFTV
jgi:hypothetical protein